jgi:hypothetical protein
MWRIAMMLALLPGCGSAMVIHLRTPQPAPIPARAFPIVCVAGSADAESMSVADALADHLEGGPTRVVRTSADQLIPAAATQVQPALALLVTLTLGETLRTQMSPMPSVSCQTVSPCYGYPQRLPIDVRVQIGDVLVRAIDPRSGTELGRASRHAEESEPSPIAARLAVIDRLRVLAVALVDVTSALLELELDDVDDSAAHAAIDLARSGDVHEARLALDRRLADDALVGSTRTAAAFDRAQLLRADAAPTESDADEDARLAESESALLAITREAPSERHARALAQLRTDRTARADVRAQRDATDQNFTPR